MGHESIHIYWGLGGYKSCVCMCKDCVTAKGECLCGECTCSNPSPLPPLHKAYYREPAVVIARPCSECGKEVTRTGNRGRWPSKCMECKK